MDRDRRPRTVARLRPSIRSTALMAAVCLAGLTAPAPTHAASASSVVRAEVVVYGGTPGGILAAVTASRAGAGVILLEPSRHLGGLMSSGLGATDVGDKTTLRGYTGEFFDRTQAGEGTVAGRFRFQPHTAEQAFRGMLHSTDAVVRYGERILDASAVVRDGTHIRAIRTTSGTTYEAAVFIDASYTGDLMAQAGVKYRIGREGQSVYGESLAGVRPSQYLLTLDDTSARPFLTEAPGPVGSGDQRIQDSNYRVCFSSDPANQAPFARPDGYRSHDYDIYVTYLKNRAATSGVPAKLSWILSILILPNAKYDVNDVGPLSTAVPGLNWDYPKADHEQRLEIERKHREFTQGLFYHLRNNRRVPSSVRVEMARYGLCKDEFTDNDHWPRSLYLREGRRMLGAYVLRQSDIEKDRSKTDIIGVASYRVDSHFVSRWVTDDNRLMVEGGMSLPYMKYAIPYRSITPKRSDITNLLVPVAASASHVAQSSLRMEPQYMIMGEAAGEAAALALSRRYATPPPTGSEADAPNGAGGSSAGSATIAAASMATSTVLPRPTTDVQAIDVAELQRRLKAHGVYLTNPSTGSSPLSNGARVDVWHHSPGG
jgi:FAD dependent oxidoreductase